MTRILVLAAAAAAVLAPLPSPAGCREAGRLTFESPHARNAVAFAPDGRILIVNTDNNSISIGSGLPTDRRVQVGVEPVSIAVHPDGREAWVANYVSDSLSVIDLTREVVVATVQDTVPRLDGQGRPNPDFGRTLFDEPWHVQLSGDGSRAYVALAGMNQVAVIDTATRSIVQRIPLDGTLRTPAGAAVILERPRGLALFGGERYLAIAAFEGGNRSETRFEDGWPARPEFPATARNELRRREECFPGSERCTRGAALYDPAFCKELCAAASERDVVIAPERPDRDLAVIDLRTGEAVAMAGDLGTLLYDLIETTGALQPPYEFVLAVTEAQNERNGLDALAGQPWLNRLVKVSFDPASGFGVPDKVDAGGANPYSLLLTPDGSSILVTLSGSRRIQQFDRNLIKGGIGVAGHHPTGLGMHPSTGYLYVVNRLGPDTWEYDGLRYRRAIAIRSDWSGTASLRGAQIVYDALRSTGGSFACASCHPFMGSDHLAWDFDRDLAGGEGAGPRVTQVMRGLKGSSRFHRDGSFADLAELVNSTFTKMGSGLTAAQVGDVIAFLEAVAHLPSSRRAPGDALTPEAKAGMQAFFDPAVTAGMGSCANQACHAAPRWTSSRRTFGMEAPSLRALDRNRSMHHDGMVTNLYLAQSLGFVAEPLDTRFDARLALDAHLFASFVDYGPSQQAGPLLAFLAETSTGIPAVFGRQVTRSADNAGDPEVADRLDQVFAEAERAKVALRLTGTVRDGATGLWFPLDCQFDPAARLFCGCPVQDRAEAERLADAGEAVLTFLADLGKDGSGGMLGLSRACVDCSAPALDAVPLLAPGRALSLTLEGEGFVPGLRLLVDGKPAPESPLPDATTVLSETSLGVDVPALPAGTGELWVLSLASAEGGLSNDFPLAVGCAGIERIYLWKEAGELRARWITRQLGGRYRVYQVERREDIESARQPLAPLVDAVSDAVSLGAVDAGADLEYFKVRPVCGVPEVESP